MKKKSNRIKLERWYSNDNNGKEKLYNSRN